jgi:hypothetical protein
VREGVELRASGGGPRREQQPRHGVQDPKTDASRCWQHVRFSERAQQVCAAEHDQRAPGQREQLLESSSLDIDDCRLCGGIRLRGNGSRSALVEEGQTLLEIANAVAERRDPRFEPGDAIFHGPLPELAAGNPRAIVGTMAGNPSIAAKVPADPRCLDSSCKPLPVWRSAEVEIAADRDYPAREVRSR